MIRPLSELINRFTEMAHSCPAVRLTVPADQAEHLAKLLRELRARRIAMGREPDDELNAWADMCCCRGLPRVVPAVVFRDGCPMHPGPVAAIGPLLRCGAWRFGGCDGCDYLGRTSRNGGLEESDCALCDVAEHWRAP